MLDKQKLIEEFLAETSPRVLAGALDFDPTLVAGVMRGEHNDPFAREALKRLDVGKRARSNKDALRQTHDVLKRGTSGDYVSRLTKALPDFADYKDWYAESSGGIDKHFKTPVTHYGKLMTGLIAATSPQSNTGLNLKQALQAADDIIMGNPLSGMSSKVGNIVRTLTDTGLSGQKVHSFHHNLSGNPEFTTVDSHELAGQLNDFKAVVSPEDYKNTVTANRKLKDKTGWTPMETQAAVWAFDIARTGGNHPSFHTPGSPFHSYSELAGGHLPSTVGGKPVQAAPTHSYGEYLDKGDNPSIIKSFTDRWDAKIASDPDEHARVKDTHYTAKNFIRGVDMSKSDLKNPNLVATLVGRDQLLPDQTITNPYGDLIKQTAREFNPELHRAIKAQREDVEYNSLINSITEALLA
jgi:hypothetical protein